MPAVSRATAASAWHSSCCSNVLLLTLMTITMRLLRRRQAPAPIQDLPCIDAAAYPHILDAVIAFSPPSSLRKIRQVSRTMASKVDPLLTNHLIIRFRSSLTHRIRLEHPDGRPFPVLSYILERDKRLDPWGFYTIPRASIVDMHDPPLDSLAAGVWAYILDSKIQTLRLFRTAFPHAVYRFTVSLHVPRLILDMYHSRFDLPPSYVPMVTAKVDTLVLYLHVDQGHPLLAQTTFAAMNMDIVGSLVIIFDVRGKAGEYLPGPGILTTLMPQLAKFVREKDLTVVNAKALPPAVRGFEALCEKLAAVGDEEKTEQRRRHVRCLSLEEYRELVGDEQFELDTCQ